MTDPVSAPAARDLRPADTGPYVFVSYASVDRARVLRIAETLTAEGLGVWMDQADITGGISYGPEITAGIKNADALLLMCSTASLASRNVRQEIQLAWRFGRRILPLRLDPVEFPEELVYWLEGAQWIEVLDRPESDWLPRLRRALGRIAPGGVADDVPAAPVAAAPTNLPPALSALLGREQDLTEVRTLLANGRLVTLTGPGGTGKTRLAIEAARGLATVDTYPDGVWLVDLAPITDPDLVPSAVAAVLQVGEQPGQPLAETLTAALANQTLLLVLDNVEQVASAADFVGALVEACPGLSVLATSRVPLRLPVEWAYPVSPLETPDTRNLPPVPTLARNPSVRLFVERAKESRPDFALTVDNALPVAEICRRLDGLPLALELAAARVKLLPPAALLARLGSRLNVLTRGAGASPRQQTLRAAIAWSYDLLDPAEQAVFRRLAVFAGGCTLAAAEAVAGDGGRETGARDDAPSVLDAVAELVDQSLLRPDGGTDDEPRFRMLETIREFGLEALATNGEAEAIPRAHARYFAGFAETAAPEFAGPRQAQTLASLETDHDNLRAALDWLHQDGSAPETEVRMAAALWEFWSVRGYLSEGRARLERALERGDEAPPTTQAAALNGLGAIAVSQGDGDRAVTLHERALALARGVDDQATVARSLSLLGEVADIRGDYDRAIALHEEALAIRRTLGDDAGIAATLLDLGFVALNQGANNVAVARIEESLPVFRKVGNTRNVAIGLDTLGILAYVAEDYPRAIGRYKESLALWRVVGDRQGTANCTFNLGRALLLSGQRDQALDLFEELAPIYRDLGDRASLAVALWSVARIVLDRGETDRAAALLAESLPLCQQSGEQRTLAEGIEIVAAVAAARGHPVTGARLLGATERLREDLGAPLNAALRAEYDRYLAAIRAHLDEPDFAAAWAAGRDLTPAQAIAEALATLD